MKIQILAGGLANQIRHYNFVRFAERYTPASEWWFDDSYFYAFKMHNGYELEKLFGVHLRLLSQFFDAKTWETIVGQRKRGVILPQTLLDMGMPIVLFEGRLHVNQAVFSGEIIKPEGEHLGFHPEYIDLPYENVYYHAEWASKKWFEAYEEENRKELQFPLLTDRFNLEYADQINDSYAVGLHIRRGDFQVVGWDLPAEAYKPACQRAIEEHPDARFFIFSDDLDWCRANEKELGFDLARKTIYVSGNTGEKSYIDMQLLSMCKGIIRNAESSFSQVAGWFDRDLEFEIKLKPDEAIFKSYK